MRYTQKCTVHVKYLSLLLDFNQISEVFTELSINENPFSSPQTGRHKQMELFAIHFENMTKPTMPHMFTITVQHSGSCDPNFPRLCYVLQIHSVNKTTLSAYSNISGTKS